MNRLRFPNSSEVPSSTHPPARAGNFDAVDRLLLLIGHHVFTACSPSLDSSDLQAIFTKHGSEGDITRIRKELGG